LIDLREKTEREKHGVIPGSLHLPYPQVPSEIGPGGILHELAAASGKRLVFYCAFGERSAWRRRMPASRARVTLPAVSTPGRKRADRSRIDPGHHSFIDQTRCMDA
jgi:Rhodanese-like domain